MAAAIQVPGIGRVTLNQLRSEAARRTPAMFGYIVSNGKFTLARHINFISDKIAAGLKRGGWRGIICAPPRHAKSTTVTEKTPAWFLTRWPEKSVIIGTYGDEFSETWGRKIRDVMLQASAAGMTQTQIVRGADSAVGEWRTSKGGGLFTAGILGPILGRGTDLLIVDDPCKNAEEAYSPRYQERLRDWYQSTASTRLEPGASVIVTMQRWPSSDFVSWLIDQNQSGREKWELISLPAIAEADDQLGRAIGEPLWPERFGIAALEKIRLSLVDPAFWGSQWQQAPPEESTEGLAYHAFSSTHSVLACPYNPRQPIYLACDFNVNPMSWLIAQSEEYYSPDWYDTQTLTQYEESSRKTIRVLGEISLPNSNTFAATDEFIARVNTVVPNGARIEVAVYGDASGNSRKTTGATDYQVIRERLERAGRFTVAMRTTHNNPPVRDRVTTVNNAFLNAMGQRRLLIDPGCKELVEDLKWMRWKLDVAGNSTNELDESNPRRSHMSSALGYLCWGELKMQGKSGWM